MTRKSKLFILIISVITALMMGALAVSAQDTPLPIEIGENQTGSLTTAAPILRYVLLVDTAQTINVRVFAITPGLLPLVTVLDGNGSVVAVAQNNGTQTAVQAAGIQVQPGLYRLEVSSANNLPGDVLVNVQGIQVAPPTPLPIGQIVNGSVSSTAPIIRYSFVGAADQGRWLFVQSLLATGGPSVSLFDGVTNESLASVGSRMRGTRLQIPAGGSSFVVEVTHSGSASAEAYLICVALENNPASCPVTGNVVATQPPPIVVTEIVVPTLPATLLPPLPPSSVCILGSATGQVVNVRFGPSTTFPVLTTMNSTVIANVIGKLPDGTWYQINVGGLTGWISASVVRLGGPCQLVPIVVPTATPTIGAPVTLTPTPTQTLPFTVTPTATATLPPPPAPTLNYSLPAVFGSTSLTSGFVPDPFQIGITAGGPANATYLGAGCRGYMTSAPSFSVNYTSGAFPTLRFYFIGGGDTTMVINSPSGSYFCSDDSFGTLNPTIDFSSPSGGRYDVWIGTFGSGGSIGGTLYVTENTGNHP